MIGIKNLTAEVKRLALQVGFARVAIASAGDIPAKYRENLACWLGAGSNGSMDYFDRGVDLRHSPAKLLQGAKSVICLAVPRGNPHQQASATELQVARYAQGRDYHKVLKSLSRSLIRQMNVLAREQDITLSARAFVDTAPVMERTLAAMAGMGWVGKNGCLFVPQLGSFVALCEIVCNWQLLHDIPIESKCNSCDKCITACPTAAIYAPAMIDARKCISYWNQSKGDIPLHIREKMGNWSLGCDICQQACPHNASANIVADVAIADSTAPPRQCWPIAEVLSWDFADWDRATAGAGLRAIKYKPLLRNASIAAGNSGKKEFIIPLKQLIKNHPDLQNIASWAIGQLEKHATDAS